MTRSRARRMVFGAAIAATLVGVGLTIPLAGTAVAQQTVSVSPAGPYDNGQTLTVTGTGFTGIPSTGLQILECADPGGTTANLPTDSSTGCDGTTVSGNVISPDPTTGDFSTTYQVLQLSIANGNTINCDTGSTNVNGQTLSDECVLWVGEDYVNLFLTGPHAFSAPFAISSVVATTPEAPLAIALPGAAVLVVGAYVVIRRRRQQPSSNAA